MRAYRSCASARWGWRSKPVNATRCAASSWRFCRSSSPRRRYTRLSGSWASWEESALTSSAMDAGPAAGEGLCRRPGALHRLALRQLRFGATGEPLPLVPLLHGLCEATGRDERVAQHAMSADEEGIEPQRAAQLLDRLGTAPRGEPDPAEQQVDRGVVGVGPRRLLGGRARAFEVAPRERVLRLRHRSEEHTSELQSQSNLVCRLLLEKKKQTQRKLSPMYER